MKKIQFIWFDLKCIKLFEIFNKEKKRKHLFYLFVCLLTCLIACFFVCSFIHSFINSFIPVYVAYMFKYFMCPLCHFSVYRMHDFHVILLCLWSILHLFLNVMARFKYYFHPIIRLRSTWNFFQVLFFFFFLLIFSGFRFSLYIFPALLLMVKLNFNSLKSISNICFIILFNNLTSVY